MEPFTIRCETCKAKLRVRDERVLGQIHECPKCHSMVLIAAPGAVAATASSVIASATQESIVFPTPVAKPATAPSVPEFAMPEAASAAAVEAPPIAIRAAAVADWSRVIIWSAGGAALFIAGSIVGAVLLRGGDEQVAETAAPAAVVESAPEAPAEESVAAVTAPEEVVEEAPAAVKVAVEQPAEIEAALPAAEEMHEAAPIAPPQKAPVVVAQEAKPERTLTLEPVKPAATMGDIAAQLEAPDYEEVVEPVAVPVAAKPQAAVDAGRATNVRQQLALPIAAMEINSLPLDSFIEMISEMSAVRIVADADTLKAAGVSPRAKVRVAGREETIESLLTAVLDQHHLAWEERDGQIVIVPAR